ncbi:hypothetical protein LWI28_027975 [Acer negundo]|uniref:Uncharacterized protein n=1 Tax=Acer negundo TaxID=4023 RepID=A0AAD5IXN9_ACENE|nr:hypothetical protein LWI28_027975 [Acer negundo]
MALALAPSAQQRTPARTAPRKLNKERALAAPETNPVNHRVFERKLRPKPLGRGHACLGVTHRCPAKPLSSEETGGLGRGRILASRVPNGLRLA